jgi:hypothetical protein
MKPLLDDEVYEFSTGRKAYANRCIVGIRPDTLEISEGYDGSFDAEWARDESTEFTKQEKLELADFMLATWRRYKDAAEHDELGEIRAQAEAEQDAHENERFERIMAARSGFSPLTIAIGARIASEKISPLAGLGRSRTVGALLPEEFQFIKK